MASSSVCEIGNKIVDVINKGAAEKNLTCGEVIELICILNSNMADWLSQSMDLSPTELLAQIYTLSQNCHDTAHEGETTDS